MSPKSAAKCADDARRKAERQRRERNFGDRRTVPLYPKKRE